MAFLISCNEEGQIVNPELQGDSDWHLKDLEKDTVPGISLERAYKELIQPNSGEEIIVAVIDTQVDLSHEDLNGQIYINPNEIENNGVDDDTNGYIDDVHGWNFLGYGKHSSLEYSLYDHTRIVKRLQNKFKDRKKEDVEPKDMAEYLKYLKAAKSHNKSIVDAEELLQASSKYKDLYIQIKERFSDRFPLYDSYFQYNLDTVTPRNEEEEKLLKYLKRFKTAGLDLETLFKEEKYAIIQKYTSNNLNYNERKQLGDNPYDYDNGNYGNNNVQASQQRIHGTQVSGIIAANRSNGTGIKGASNRIKLMVLPIFTIKGNEHDKDFYNAVRYAVDNGARVINFSSGKPMVDNEHLVFNALKYAENNNVLVVTSSGNSASDIDKPEHNSYPMDLGPNGNTVGNLIKVGSSSRYLDNRIYSSFSNYGKQNVDVFAPGEGIRTTTSHENRYHENVEGTSISSALTSGVAALLLSQYPDLNAIQVKNILMESGTEYDVLVKTRENDSVPFKELSKSGKVLNAYNALKMAAGIISSKK